MADSFEISSSSSTNYTNQEWNFKVTFINLDTNQADNQNKNLTGKVLIQQDKIAETIADVAKSGDNLVVALKELSTKSFFSLTHVYYHDASLTNGAGDNSYRYAGASADVNNYICLGSSETSCPADNLYRIIGVFDENNHGVAGEQLVKVIRSTSYGTYAWDTTNNNDWRNASLNTVLNSTFKTVKLSGIEDKIAEVKWKISGTDEWLEVAKAFYISEMKYSTAVIAKIGLMYASDYGFATTQDYWTTELRSYDKAAKNKDWLYLGTNEWALTPYSSSGRDAWVVQNSGRVTTFNVDNLNAVRPSFYLLSSVTYASGTGSLENPIRLT